jgi:hypothetical protein
MSMRSALQGLCSVLLALQLCGVAAAQGTVCLGLSEADGLGEDCDLFDDGVGNSSCETEDVVE